MNLIWCQVCTFTVLSGGRSALSFLRAQMYAFSSTFIKRFKPLSIIILIYRGYCWIGENSNKRTELRRDAYNQSKKYLEILICFWFQWMSQSNLFVIKVWQFLVLYLTCSCMNFNSPLTRPWIKQLNAKTTKFIPKYWQRSVKTKSNLNFIRVTKSKSFDQHFLWCKSF